MPSAISTVKGCGNTYHVDLTITTGTYAPGASVGGAITVPAALNEGARAYVYSVTLGGQTTATPYELWFFNADLATPAVNGALMSTVAADAPKFQGVIDITASDYRAGGSGLMQYATVVNRGLVVKTTAGTQNVIAYLKNVAASTGGVTSLSVNIGLDYMD